MINNFLHDKHNIYRNILFITIYVFIVTKISTDPNADCSDNYTQDNKNHAITCTLIFCSNKAISVNFASSILSLHFSTYLSTNLFLHLQFS